VKPLPGRSPPGAAVSRGSKSKFQSAIYKNEVHAASATRAFTDAKGSTTVKEVELGVSADFGLKGKDGPTASVSPSASVTVVTSLTLTCGLSAYGRIAFAEHFGDIFDMSKGTWAVVFVLVFAAVGFGQTTAAPTSGERARVEFMDLKYWSKIGEQKDPVRGFTLYSRNLLPNPEGQIEFWVKIVPTNIAQFNKRYGLASNAAFVLQYATVDCTRNVLLLERTGIYDAGNVRINSGGPSSLTPKSSRDRVKPGSVGAEIFQSICVKL